MLPLGLFQGLTRTTNDDGDKSSTWLTYFGGEVDPRMFAMNARVTKWTRENTNIQTGDVMIVDSTAP